MRYLYLFSFLMFCFSCEQQEDVVDDTIVKLNYEHPIPFAPEKYICFRNNGKMFIDGKATEHDWKNLTWSKEFVDIRGALQPKPYLKTRVKMLWDEDYFYVYAQLEEPHVWAKLKERDAVIFYDNDFEIFIDPDGDSHDYYELEINAFNTLWELILLRPYRADGGHKVLNNWNIPNIKSAIHIEGTLNDPSDEDKYWAVEMAIPWSALKEFASPPKAPKDGDQWRINFSRVEWQMNIEDGKYFKAKDPSTGKNLHENNWVWSPTGFVNMHMPEQWGYVQFSTDHVGSGQTKFIEHEDEKIKWALWNMYFQQREFFKKNNIYTDDLNQFTIPILENSSCEFQPQIFTTPNLFEISSKSCEQDGSWSIRQDGKIDFYKNRKE